MIRDAAAIPFPGMLMSSRQTSGCVDHAPRDAEAVSWASTQTRNSPVLLERARTSALSVHGRRPGGHSPGRSPERHLDVCSPLRP